MSADDEETRIGSDEEMRIGSDEIATRRDKVRHAKWTEDTKVAFRVAAMYGIGPKGMKMPLSRRDSIESGQVCATIDPDAGSNTNVGVIDYAANRLKVKYHAQLVFPGLFELVTSKKYDPALLRPVRATATDDCKVTGEMDGWRAFGCMDFLPGSLWAGASGG
jgi:hypothetical protein